MLNRGLLVAVILLCVQGAFAQASFVQIGAPAQVPAGNCSQGQTDFVAFGFGASVVTGAPTNFTGLTLTHTGTALPADWVRVRLIRDNNLNLTVDMTDTVLATVNSSAFPAVFTSFSNAIPAQPNAAVYLLAVDVSATATLGRTFIFSVAQNSHYTATAAVVSGAPVNGNAQTIQAASTAEIDVRRASTSIPTGGTDNLGNQPAGTNVNFTYTILNTGTQNLVLSGSPAVDIPSLSVTNCTAAVTTQPTTPVAASAQTTFVVQVNASMGAFGFGMTIPNNDSNENPYNIIVSGTGVTPAPEMDVTRGATPITSGGTDNVGSGFTVGTGAALTYTFSNSGTAQLTLTNPATIGSLSNCAVVITTAPTSPVAASGSTTTTLTVTPAAAGTFSFTYSIANNDASENPYNWTVSGSADAPALVVQRGALVISDGGTDALTSPLSFTAGSATVVTYRLRNTGLGTLTLSNPATISATVNCTATITAAPAATVAPMMETTTDISVTPMAGGPFSFNYSIANNDPMRNPFNWTASGNATSVAPEMQVIRSTIVADGSTDSVGNAATGMATNYTYTIDNNAGTANLTLTVPVAAPGSPANCSANIATQPAATVAPGGATTTLVVAVTPAAAGPFSCTISIGNNDPNENPYDWTISGTGVAPAPEMDVTEGVTAVADGSTQALGNVPFGAAQSMTYTITNSGTAALNLTGAPSLVAVTPGFNVGSLSVTSQPTTPVATASFVQFTLTYTVTAAGAFSFTVSIDNNDANENPYNWTVSGTGATVAEMDVSRGATTVADGGTDAQGTVNTGAAQTLNYSIFNNGTAVLNLSGLPIVALAGQSNCTASVTTQPAAATVAAAGSATFVVSYTVTAAGAFSFSLSIANDDPNENPYDWTVSGTGTASGGGGGGGGDDGGGCAAGEREALTLLFALVAACLVALRARRRHV